MTGHFEAKLTAKRETAAGIYLTVQVQPDDYVADLATLRVGSALILGWSEIVNTAVEPLPAYVPEPPTVTLTATKEKRPFNSLPLSQQAAIRATDEKFQEWLEGRSCILEATEEAAASYIRRWCGITSRRDIVDGDRTGSLWHELERDYKAHLTDIQYAGARR